MIRWIISYIDVPVGEPFISVEEHAADGWEPFAITAQKGVTGRALESNIQRFWFKRRID